MRRSLHGIRRRVEQLAMTTKLGGCTGEHQYSFISHVHNDEPDPDPPTWAERCACGAVVRVTHVIHRFIHELPDDGSPGSGDTSDNAPFTVGDSTSS